MIRKSSEYMIALLNLMSTLPGEKGSERNVLGAFIQTYSNRLPQDHLVELPNGDFRWEIEVLKAIPYLERESLLDSPNRGIWRLTQEGRQWLREHQYTDQQSKTDYRKSQPNKHQNQASRHIPRSLDISRDEFFKSLEQKLKSSLKTILDNTQFVFVQRSNYLQILIEGFRGCHYD